MTEWTLCWRCNASYQIDLACCPACKATNGNVDIKTAEREMIAKLDAEFPLEPTL